MKKNLHPSRIEILRVPFDVISCDEALNKLQESLHHGKALFCVTPNPEMCLMAKKNEAFLNVLREADLSVPDGFGIPWAGRFLAGPRSPLRFAWTLLTPWKTTKLSPFPERVTGTDLMMAFLKSSPCSRIFLLGASELVNERLAKKLRSEGVNIVGNLSSSPAEKNEVEIRKMIVKSEAKVLFVAFGAPAQELWIARNLMRLPNLQLVMGVGGAFDFLSGEKRRAPKFFQSLGFEWFWRLLLEPWRIRRILNATVLFPLKVYLSEKP